MAVSRRSTKALTSGSLATAARHLALVVLGRALQLAGVDDHARGALEGADQRQRDLRVGRGRHVVGHRRPQAHRRQVGRGARVVEHAGDPGRALVAGVLEAQLVHQRRVGGDAADGHRAGVRHVGQQRAERDDHVRVELARDLHDRLGCSGASAATARRPGGSPGRARRRTPRAADTVVSGHSISRVRPSISRIVGRTVVKSRNSSGSMRATSVGSKRARMNSTAADAASPASFQPRKAATSTGRRSAGRSFQITSDMCHRTREPRHANRVWRASGSASRAIDLTESRHGRPDRVRDPGVRPAAGGRVPLLPRRGARGPEGLRVQGHAREPVDGARQRGDQHRAGSSWCW